MGWTPILFMCILWPWPWKYTIIWRSWHIIGSWTAIVWNIIEIQHDSKELWPRHRFCLCVYCNLGLGDMFQGLTNRFSYHLSDIYFSLSVIKLCTRKPLARPREALAPGVGQWDSSAPVSLGQGYDIPWSLGQQFCEILSRSNMAITRCELLRMCALSATVTFNLEIWPRVEVMTHPLTLDKNSV